MQIPSISSSPQAVLSNVAQNIDGSRQTPGTVGGTSKPEDSTQVSGSTGSSETVQSAAQSLDEVTTSKLETAAQVKVVTAADEALGTTLGSIINTTA
ncbi:MAG: hypothetical protein V7752_09445 [Halopseudomonas sp.]